MYTFNIRKYSSPKKQVHNSIVDITVIELHLPSYIEINLFY